MRIYSVFDEENLRTRRLVREWFAEGFLSAPQYASLEADTETTLRRTNGFLRFVLFLFTAGSVSAGIALVFDLWSIHDRTAISILIFVSSALCYGLAEYAVARGRFYRHGIEEALVTLSVYFLCYGVWSVVSLHDYRVVESWKMVFVPMAGAASSFYIYRRFGYQYAAFALLIFLAFVPRYVVASEEARRVLLCGLFFIGLTLTQIVKNGHREDYLHDEFEVVEAMLCLALYVTVNLHLTSWWDTIAFWGAHGTPLATLWRPFYWTTYGFIWLLSPLALLQAIHDKSKPLLGVGMVMALLTLITNKSYLGWVRHEWDAMLLGLFLVGTALAVRKWLASGSNGVRAGITARRLSGHDKRFLGALGMASGLLSTGPGVAPGSGVSKPDFGGGRSGGGGASASF